MTLKRQIKGTDEWKDVRKHDDAALSKESVHYF